MNCRDRCATDEYDSVIRRLEEAENKNLDQDNAIDTMRGTIPNYNVVDTLTIDVDALKDEKLDNEYMDEDIHFGPITITKDGTAVIASMDAVNPITGAVTPLSFVLPGATSTDAGVMDASSVAWIAEAETRISALEGLSDVKAIVGLGATPTQTEINTAWMGEVGKAPETGDLVQDVSNAKLWIYITDTWMLYGTVVTVPLATTTSLGGVRDTALDAPANRWYSHVEADGRLALIGGDSLSTLLDTTVPGIQNGVNNSVKKTGDTMTGPLYGTNAYFSGVLENNGRIRVNAPDYPAYGDLSVSSTGDGNCRAQIILKRLVGGVSTRTGVLDLVADGDVVFAKVLMRSNPGLDDVINKSYLDTRLTAKQDKLTFDSVPTEGSTNPVTSGGIWSDLAVYADFLSYKQDKYNLYEHTIRVWTTDSVHKVRFSLTVLNQSPTEFTLPALRGYLGSVTGEFKQCSGVVLTQASTLIHLTSVRGGAVTTAFNMEGVDVATGSIVAWTVDWMQVEVIIADKVRQIV